MLKYLRKIAIDKGIREPNVQGNVMFETDVSRHFKAMRARLNSTHKEKGNVQLTPSEVRKLRTILLSTSSHPNQTVALEGLSSTE